MVYEPTPVVALNHAVAVAESGFPDRALAQVEPLSDALAGYQPFHAVLADLLVRVGRIDAARTAYDTAIALAPSEADRSFLAARLDALG